MTLHWLNFLTPIAAFRYLSQSEFGFVRFVKTHDPIYTDWPRCWRCADLIFQIYTDVNSDSNDIITLWTIPGKWISVGVRRNQLALETKNEKSVRYGNENLVCQFYFACAVLFCENVKGFNENSWKKKMWKWKFVKRSMLLGRSVCVFISIKI